jgi:BirA family transcriptional regulator, biotin operon repressor / biotin---[acetyl-CoA-carboxylase] ligase
MFTGMPGDRARNPGTGDPGERERVARVGLAGSRFADVRWVGSTGSTNADAMALARAGAAEGVVVVADHQTAGRGRRDRTWVAPPGGSLLLSVLLRPPAGVACAVTMATGVSLAEAVEEVAGVSPGLKWPNDLVVFGPGGERKLAGILAEADWPASATASAGWRQPAAHERVALVVGVGLNVWWPTDDEGVREVADRAVALNWVAPAERVERLDRVDLLVAFLRRLDEHYGRLQTGGPGVVMDDWRRRSSTLGRRVRVELGAGDVEGTAVDVTPEGHLVVETPGGQRRAFAVGDVVHLRGG